MTDGTWRDVDDLGKAYRVRLRYETQGDHAVIRELSVEALDGSITGTNLRQIRLGKHQAEIQASLRESSGETSVLGEYLMKAEPALGSHTGAGSPSRTVRTDEEWAHIAALYVYLCQLGEPRVTEAMASQLGVRREYVPKLIARAAQHGMLEGQTQGVKGGRLTSRALEALGLRDARYEDVARPSLERPEVQVRRNPQ